MLGSRPKNGSRLVYAAAAAGAEKCRKGFLMIRVEHVQLMEGPRVIAANILEHQPSLTMILKTLLHVQNPVGDLQVCHSLRPSSSQWIMDGMQFAAEEDEKTESAVDQPRTVVLKTWLATDAVDKCCKSLQKPQHVMAIWNTAI